VKHPNEITTPRKRSRSEPMALASWKPLSDTDETNLLVALSFSLVEHPAFVALIKKLHPHYELPCAKTLSSTHLDAHLARASLGREIS